MSPKPGLRMLCLFAGLLAAPPLWGQNTIGISGCPSPVAPGASAACSINLSLGAGVSVDSLTFGVDVTPNGNAPALSSGQLTFNTSIAGSFQNTGGTNNAIGLFWQGLNPALTGSTGLGSLGFTLPGNASGGQSYSVTITGASALYQNNTVPVSIGSPATISIGSPVIGLNPSSLTFNGTQGGSNPPCQTVTVSNTGSGALNWSAMVTSGAWLSVNPPASGANGGAVTVCVNLTGLNANTYNGAIQVQATGASNTPQPISVTLNVASPPPAIGLGASSLSFTATQGGSNPLNQMVTVANSGGGTLSWSASVTSGSWLSVLPPASGANAGTITVAVNVANLTANTYTGNIQVTASGASNSPQNISVMLTVNPPLPTILLSCNSLSFSATQGGSAPPNQACSVSNTGAGNLNWAATVTSGSNFLSLTGSTSGTNSGTITLVVNQGILAPNTYTGVVQVSAPGANNSPQNILVSLTVTPPVPTIGISPGSLNFKATQGGSSPAGQVLNISNPAGGTLNWSASVTSGGTWLSLSGSTSGTNSGSITVVVTLGALTANTYAGNIQIAASGASNTPQNVAVVLTVGQPANPSIALNPASLSFTAAQGGGNPANQSVSITNAGGGTLNWSASVTSGATWLSVIGPTSGTNTGSITALATLGNLTANTYTGNIQISAPGATAQNIAVTFTVTPPLPAIGTSPTALYFAAVAGGSNPINQTVVINNTGGGTLNWLASVTGGGVFLTLSGPASGTNRGSITAVVTLGSLTPGTYNGNIQIAASGAITRNIPVTLAVGGAIQVTPSTLNFTYAIGGQTPAPQQVSVSTTANSAVPIAGSPGCGWVSVNPGSGTTPIDVNISVNPAGLAANTYTCLVTFNGPASPDNPNSQQAVVNLTVSSPPTVAPSTLQFVSTQGSSTPSVSTIAISGAPVMFTATAQTSSGANWLTLSTSSGTTPAVITVQANPSGLSSTGPAAPYSGTVTIGLPNGTQAVNVTLSIGPVIVAAAPASIVFHCLQGGSLPEPQILSIIASDNSPVNFTTKSAGPLTVTSTPGGQNISVGLAPNGCQSLGSAAASVTVNAPAATPPVQTVPITINVDPPPLATPVLSVSPAGLTYSFVQGAAAQTQTLTLANQGGGTLNVTPTNSTLSGGSWLSVSCGSTALAVSTPSQCSVTADPSKVNPNSLGGIAGTYSGEIDLTGDQAGQNARIPVTMTISAVANVLISRAGLSFSVAESGANPPADTVDILDATAGMLNWTAEPTTATGGNWLKLNNSSGTATLLSPANLSVSVDSTALPPGALPGPYYGSIIVSASDAATGQPAANSPRTVAVVLNVLAPGSYLSPIVRPGGLTFTGNAGASDVPAQSLTAYNLGSSPLSYSSAAVTDDGGTWCHASPADGGVPQSGQIAVQVEFTNLAAGTHRCNLRLLFGDGSLQNISVLAVASAPGSVAMSVTSDTHAVPRESGCDASNLPWTVNLTAPAQGATVIAYQATDLEVTILDGCNVPVNGADVSATFSDGDQYQKLSGIGTGTYHGSWTPTNIPASLARTQVSLDVTASAFGTSYKQGGSTPIVTVTVAQTVTDPTLISRTANSASYAPIAQVAPCTWVAIFGQALADPQVIAKTVPFGTQLGHTSVLLGGIELPLYYVDTTQINAQIPCGVNPDTQLDLQVIYGTQQSPVEPIVISDTHPALFTENQEGFGPGAITWTTPAGVYALADAANPVSSGDAISIYCTGLGQVNPPVTEGAAAPFPPGLAQTTQMPSVTIGGLPAQVLFSGLSPGLVGVYQINVVVPNNVTSGNAVPVLVTMGLETNPQSSQAGVTIAVR